MIVFDLVCHPGGHVFEAWFGSSGDYENQSERGLVECPLCGTLETKKAVMAPRVGAKGNSRAESDEPKSTLVSSDPEGVKRMLAAMVAAQKQILANSEYVGHRFAEEARAIHVGDADVRPIHGRTTPEESECLADEGIAVTPLPFPVIEPDRCN